MLHVAPDVLLAGGLTVSIPTRYDLTGTGGNGIIVQALALVSRAYFDIHRLFPGAVFVRIPLGAEVRFADYFHYRGDFTPVIMAPVAKGFPNKSAQVLIEHSDEIEARAPFGLGGGLRFQVVFAATDFASSLSGGTSTGGFGAGDRAQTALEPFVGYEPRGSGFFARLGCLVALDTPAGFGFNRDKVATVRTTLGGKF